MESMMRTDKRPGRQGGMSLIEAMVAVFILAAGLLGLAALQARSLAYAESSFYRSIAADLAADLADRIRANRPPFFALNDSVPPVRVDSVLPARQGGLAAVPKLSTCVQADLKKCPAVFNVVNDMTSWDAALRAQLPTGATWTLANPEKVVAPHQVPLLAADPNAVPDDAVMGWRYTLTITWLDDRSGQNASYVTVIE
jgi:type IV pilus assembly protein PilV